MSHLKHLPHILHLPHVFDAGQGRGLSFVQVVAALAPTAWWRMASTADSSGNGHTLTLVAAPSQAAVGAVKNDANAATLFVAASSQGATAASAADLNLAAGLSVTLACWVKFTTIGAQKTLMSKGINGAPYSLEVKATNKITFGIPFVVDDVILSTTSVTVGDWIHVALTRSGNNYVLYYNGVSDATATDANAFGSGNSERFTIGCFDNGGNLIRPIDATMDEVLFFKGTALTAAQVLALYTASAKTKVTVVSAVGTDANTVAMTFSSPCTFVGDTSVVFLFDASGDYVAALGPGGTVIFTGTGIGDAAAWSVVVEDRTEIDFGADKYLKCPSTGLVT